MPDWPAEKVIEAMERVADESAPFELTTQTIHCKSSPYQKITLGIEKSPVLLHIHQRVNHAFEGKYSKKNYPHISFLYSTLPCKKLRKDLKEIAKISPEYVFADRIALVHCKGTPEEWRTLYMCALNS